MRIRSEASQDEGVGVLMWISQWAHCRLVQPMRIGLAR